MNRFDRVVAIWMLFQSRHLITAQEMAERFNVSIRTIYRDIRTLENAGLPILSEAGVGYSLDRGYRLPPVVFDREEALALFMAEKFIAQSSDQITKTAYLRALTKIRAVLNETDKSHLDGLDNRIRVQASTSSQTDPWLMEAQHAIARSQIIEIEYLAGSRAKPDQRKVEPIGLYFYSQHWHLIAWCRLREGYRDFRLDRIQALSNTGEWFDQRSRGDLESYLKQHRTQLPLEHIEVQFENKVASFTHNSRQWYGFIEESGVSEEWVSMRFLTPSLEYFGRWIMSYTHSVRVIGPPALKQKMNDLAAELTKAHN